MELKNATVDGNTLTFDDGNGGQIIWSRGLTWKQVGWGLTVIGTMFGIMWGVAWKLAQQDAQVALIPGIIQRQNAHADILKSWPAAYDKRMNLVVERMNAESVKMANIETEIAVRTRSRWTKEDEARAEDAMKEWVSLTIASHLRRGTP